MYGAIEDRGDRYLSTKAPKNGPLRSRNPHKGSFPGSFKSSCMGSFMASFKGCFKVPVKAPIEQPLNTYRTTRTLMIRIGFPQRDVQGLQ